MLPGAVADVRIVTNRSSGKTAYWLSKNAFYRGANVELWYGSGKATIPSYINTVSFESIEDILKQLKDKDLKKYDIIIFCAALSDYIPKKQKGKIPSGIDKLILEMLPAPKIISMIRQKTHKAKIIGFKVEEKKDELEEKAMELLKNNNLDFVVCNTISGFNRDENEIWIIDKNGNSSYKKGEKENLTDYILDVIKQ